MRLDVPFIRQPRGSVWCGAACAAMVLQYYGRKVSQQRAVKEIPVTKTGVSVNRLGQYFLREGFDATIQFWLPGLEPQVRGFGDVPRNYKFEESLENKSEDEKAAFLEEALCRGVRQRRDAATSSSCKELLTFLNRGGNVILEPPFTRDIAREISNQHPVILCIDTNFLESACRTRKGHFIVVTDIGTEKDVIENITESSFRYHDPYYGPNLSCAAEEMLYASHSWYGSAIYIHPRS